jgi:hypothetical protein
MATLGKVVLTCEVDASPAEVTFSWSLNGSRSLSSSAAVASNGTRSVIRYTSAAASSLGSSTETLLCLAENSAGRQAEPCVFTVLTPAAASGGGGGGGTPLDPVQGCAVRDVTMSSFSVSCSTSYTTPSSTGFPSPLAVGVNFTLEVYLVPTSPSTGSGGGGGASSGQQSLTGSTEESPPVGRRLLANLTAVGRPHFHVQSLPAGRAFVLRVTAVGVRGGSGGGRSWGASPAVSLEAATLAEPAPHAHTSSTSDEYAINPILVLLVGLAGTLVSLSAVILVVLKMRSRETAYRVRTEPKAKRRNPNGQFNPV